MENDDVVEAVTVVAVSSSGLFRVGCSVRTRLCALSRCEAIEVDITNRVVVNVVLQSTSWEMLR